MSSRKTQEELSNMVMVYDKDTHKVLVQNRVKSWKGCAFPGGHVELGESFYDSAVREIKEETGLIIKNLEYCGMAHWIMEQGGHYIVFLYRTHDYEGELLPETEEGSVFWHDLPSVEELSLSSGFERYLPIFLTDKPEEGFGFWDQEKEVFRVF